MRRYLAYRIARIVPVLVIVSIAAFALLHLAPGGPAGILSGRGNLSGEDLARIEANLGLDRPAHVQYLLWFKRVFLELDFGTSYAAGRPVSAMILERLPATAELMAAAFGLALALALSAGVAAGLRRGRALDEIVSVASAAGMAAPVFWLGVVAIWIFSLRLGLLPSGGRESIGGGGLLDHLRHLALPAATLATGFGATWALYVRAQVSEAARGDFVRTARAKGLSERAVVWKHVLRPSLLPLATAVVLQAPAFFTGAVITETVFAWPGMGRLFYEALSRRDYPLVLGVMVVASFLVILCNLAGDLLNAAIDPRISYARDSAAAGAGAAPGGPGAGRGEGRTRCA